MPGKPQPKRPLERINLYKEMNTLERFEKGTPKSKKPQVNRILSKLDTRYKALEKQVSEMHEHIGRHKFNKSVINGLSEIRKKEMKNLEINTKPYMYENVEQKIRDGFTPEQLLAAGYSPEDVTKGWYRTMLYK